MLKENNCCFVLIDVQEKLTRVVKDPHKLKKNIAILLQAFNCLDVPVIWCQQAPKALGDTVPELLEYLKDNNPVNKKSFSCAGSEECNEKISNLNPENIILAGIESHICVYRERTPENRQKDSYCS